jgi:hypothetical protein
MTTTTPHEVAKASAIAKNPNAMSKIAQTIDFPEPSVESAAGAIGFLLVVSFFSLDLVSAYLLHESKGFAKMRGLFAKDSRRPPHSSPRPYSRRLLNRDALHFSIPQFSHLLNLDLQVGKSGKNLLRRTEASSIYYATKTGATLVKATQSGLN